MGAEKHLYRDGKYVCSLGRSYRFKDLYDDDDIHQVLIEIAAKMHWPQDYTELEEQCREYADKMHGFINECKRLGAKELLDYILMDEGVTVKDE